MGGQFSDMLRRSPPNVPVPAPAELSCISQRASSSLLPHKSVAQWPLMSRLQRPTRLKPLLMPDRLKHLQNAAIFTNDFTTNDEENGGRGGTAEERRIRFLENSIKFLRKEHEELLSALHQEVDSLKKTNQSTIRCVIVIYYSH